MKANLEFAPAQALPQEMPEDSADFARAVSIPKPLSVLVANNSFLLRTRLCSLLAVEPALEVTAEAGSALETLLRFRAQQPDAVILDVQFPDGSGLEVLRKIKFSAPQCAVILLSNSCTPEYRPEFLRRGADHAFHTATEFEQAVDVLTALARERRAEASR